MIRNGITKATCAPRSFQAPLSLCSLFLLMGSLVFFLAGSGCGTIPQPLIDTNASGQDRGVRLLYGWKIAALVERDRRLVENLSGDNRQGDCQYCEAERELPGPRTVTIAISSPLYHVPDTEMGTTGIVEFVPLHASGGMLPIEGRAPDLFCGGLLLGIRSPEGVVDSLVVGFIHGEFLSKGMGANAIAVVHREGHDVKPQGEPFLAGPNLDLDAVQVHSCRDPETRLAVGMVGAGGYGASRVRAMDVLYAID